MFFRLTSLILILCWSCQPQEPPLGKGPQRHRPDRAADRRLDGRGRPRRRRSARDDRAQHRAHFRSGALLPNDVRARYPAVPWRRIVGIGNIIRHDDDEIDDRIMWDTATEKLIPLKQVVEAMLRAFEEEAS